ncbi:MAG: CsgG/HfaB family protein [Synergistaceae bacterium]|nr:CsgG/HfaB family protein [Synergistaceae bacterium]
MRNLKNAGKIFVYCAFVLLVCVFGAFSSEGKPRLAVRTFDNKTDSGSLNAPAQAITDMMTTELYNSGLFNLLERERFDYIADEISLGQSGLMDPSTAPQMGRVQGAQYMMTGAVTQYRYNAGGGFLPIPGIGGGGLASRTALVTLDIRVIHSETGRVVYAAAESGTAKQEVGGLVTKYGGFASGSYGGILAAAAREAVIRHISSLKGQYWE